MFVSFFGSIFGCSHRRTTFPLTPGRSHAGHTRSATYVACLDCGKEFAYDWQSMQIGEQVDASSRTVPQPMVMRRPA
jgi:hypothetical protein